MADEVQRPIVRNLYRQSSIETPLSPSIPSDSDSEDEKDKTPSGVKSAKGAEPSKNNESMNKLRDRFENVGIIKMMPKAGVSQNSTTEVDQKPDVSEASKGKIGPEVKSKPKKPVPPPPARSASLQKQINDTNALVMAELQNLSAQSEPGKIVETKNDQERIKPEVEETKVKKPVPPPPNARTVSLPKQSPSPSPSPLINELKNRCDKSGGPKVSREPEDRSTPENVTEDSGDELKSGSDNEQSREDRGTTSEFSAGTIKGEYIIKV